ncbi:uncharacterized protein K452DRAFT_52932 [Aplosporella prunicola CBS 121167]|uniref:EXS domain-containing protein n=1 Tax=Aplosporella prunicola CBS 121167 TaxID=1176127 RepID=A0A6A6BA88_9PEZI|nr:uncharacterized protein K452DRAFT_52932 [Aplosporella prunicola CBS 121167]KAF2140215.1 hypothetical protein K452DRAFT_52932 [Aplosporella prunicola CBS 121167]
MPHLTRYGSILASPPKRSSRGSLPTLELPEPAVGPENAKPTSRQATKDTLTTSPPSVKHPHFEASPKSGNAFEVGKTTSPTPPRRSILPSKYRSIFQPKRVNSMPDAEGTRPSLKRMLSVGSGGLPQTLAETDVPLEAYREVDVRQSDFFNFLDQQLAKIEEFYKEREDESTKRLNVLREQLHIMRDRRLDEIISQSSKLKSKHRKAIENGLLEDVLEEETPEANGSKSWLKPLDEALEAAKKLPDAARGFARHRNAGKNSKAMQELGTPSGPVPYDQNRDYVRRPDPSTVPYRTAKRKLKVALQEYYRGLELLKSYALLNRTAFRKINKKYDKTVNARPTMRYMSEKVNSAWFVQSDVIDGHIRTVEDLYARYFERGNHKIAVGKLRVKSARAGDFTGSTFRNGLMVATGVVFGVEGLVYSSKYLLGDDPTMAIGTSYLLQIYGGYFLMLLLFLLFCLDCRIWASQKINYGFVFEFDTRTQLDWRQLAELPCFFLLLEGLFVWLNFSHFGGDAMYIYYPVLLIGITVILIFLPLPLLYHRSRRWFLYSNVRSRRLPSSLTANIPQWRLLLAGLYPVEFRDFFLGDMFCSLTYAMGNIELFFCLYSRNWDDPVQCNSSHSRVLGFLSCLPGIWRALQCLRRYYDTRNFFPHLVNCGKYTWTILYYMSLSLYRLDKTWKLRAFFIFCATVNAIYCSIWDLVMDWSLMNPYANRPFLRDSLGYKQVWMYYAAIILDPILRFNWIFYAIYANDVQHSAILSFIVSLSEILRRAMWTLFRVENEHCTNVGRFRASRDIPLPYDVPASSTEISEEPDAQRTSGDARPHTPVSPGHTTGADLERQRTHESTLSRRRTFAPPTPSMRGISRVGALLHGAHAQDFERKRKPELGEAPAQDDDDEDEEDVGSGEEDGKGWKKGHPIDAQAAEDMARAEGLLDEAGGVGVEAGRS